MSTILSLLLFLFCTNSYCRTGRVDDICSTRHVFLGLGESGVLTAFKVTPSHPFNDSFHETCRMDIVTCPSCIISLNFRSLNLSCNCRVGCNLYFENPYRCDYVWIFEPPYSDASGVSFSRVFPSSGMRERDLGYKSKTRMVRIWLYYAKSYDHAFILDYKSERNRQVFLGTPHHTLKLNLSTGLISSPFFPARYPRDLVVEYVLTCVKHSDPSSEIPSMDVDVGCRIHLTFVDFLLASVSVVEFFDGSARIGIVNGTSFRPPVILSKTNSLTIRFCSLGQSSVGFKAIFSFLSEENIVKDLVEINTGCGGYLDNFGGTIMMVKMVDSQIKFFDCIWLIKPPQNFSDDKEHLYLRIAGFLLLGGNAELQIRQGLTSESPLVEDTRHIITQNFRERVISFRYGSYVRLKAFFGPATHFALVYSFFSHKECFAFPGFLCKNLRCIAKTLICDGSDHCGDNSDENPACTRELESNPARDGNKEERFQRPHYYFPKIKDFSIVRTASMFFLVSLVGLMFLASSLVLAFYRSSFKAWHRRDEDGLQSVSDLRDCLSDEVSMEEMVFDDPPSYESPPNYEEVVQVSLNKNVYFQSK